MRDIKRVEPIGVGRTVTPHPEGHYVTYEDHLAFVREVVRDTERKVTERVRSPYEAERDVALGGGFFVSSNGYVVVGKELFDRMYSTYKGINDGK